MEKIDKVLTKIAGWIEKKGMEALDWLTDSGISVAVQSFALTGGLIVVSIVYWPFWMIEKVSGWATKGLGFAREKLSNLVNSRIIT